MTNPLNFVRSDFPKSRGAVCWIVIKQTKHDYLKWYFGKLRHIFFAISFSPYLFLFIFQIIQYFIVGLKVFYIKFEIFWQKNHCKIGKKYNIFLALWVIKFLPPDHNAKKPTSLGAFGSETLFCMTPYLYLFETNQSNSFLWDDCGQKLRSWDLWAVDPLNGPGIWLSIYMKRH